MAVGIGLVALVAWRLSSGPIELEFLTPYLEEALSDPAGQQVEIGRTIAVWRGWTANPELRAENVVARGAEGQVVATVPALALSISLETLLRGVVAPARVELVEPRLHLVRDLDGSFSAEHGIGKLKPYMMPDWRGGAELMLMQRIKAAIDPLGVMNPGKVLP